ncbi:peptidase S8/S53 domain-containing protein [Lipomyces oligophaga]|uniref:peptidase S8/S53 domain-containing protein n=1 Tax=Lipomyces oligophaga TaxID=45792 RepID=UPI0034CE251E
MACKAIISLLLLCLLTSCACATVLIQLAANASIEDYLDEHPRIKSRVSRTYSIGNFRAIAADVDDSFAQKISVEPEVESASPDIQLHALDATSIVTQDHAPRHLARLAQHAKLSASVTLGAETNFNFSYNSTAGEGVDAYVIDTGIYIAHPDLEGRAVHGQDFTGEGTDDGNGHGTHVAGLIGSKTFGVAKKINLIAVKVLGATGGGTLSNVIAGIEYAANQQMATKRPSVANLSLGAVYNAILNSAIKGATESGLAVVVAAGNSGIPACAISPASSRDALTVGALDDAYDQIASFSNWGHCVDIFASGVAVVSLLNENNGTVALSGTSMASPIIAGLVGYFMSLGDDISSAFEHVKNAATPNMINWLQIFFRPFTPNKIGFIDIPSDL